MFIPIEITTYDSLSLSQSSKLIAKTDQSRPLTTKYDTYTYDCKEQIKNTFL